LKIILLVLLPSSHTMNRVSWCYTLGPQINQLEKDRDVIGQVQAVAALRAHSRTSFALVNALNNCLVDPKVLKSFLTLQLFDLLRMVCNSQD
jgi:hypothetical protein